MAILESFATLSISEIGTKPESSTDTSYESDCDTSPYSLLLSEALSLGFTSESEDKDRDSLRTLAHLATKTGACVGRTQSTVSCILY